MEELRSITKALNDGAWKAAMDTEMASIGENNTWEHAYLLAGHKAIGLKWVYRVKRDPDGSIVKYKARLVAKGYVEREAWTTRKFLRQWHRWRPYGCFSRSPRTSAGRCTIWM